MKRIAAVLTLTAAVFGIAAPTAAMAAGTPQACIHLDLNVNGQGQVIDQCLPQ